MKLSFKERARLLGHSLELLEADVPITSFISVKDVDQLKEIITKLSDTANNPQLISQLFGNVPLTDPATDHTASGTIRRVNEFIYANAPLDPSDRERIKGAFPIQIQATSSPDYTPTAPVKINSPVTPVVYNYGTVTLNQGIYINFYNTIVTGFTCDNLIRNGNNGNPNIGDINILGATGSNGTGGPVGTNGNKGSTGSGGTCTVSGSEPGDNGGKGGTGSAGATGTAGNPGGPGLASQTAVFTINNSIVSNSGAAILFFTRSGTGGSGGKGGTGGAGGAGGKGGDGANCECTGTSGGNGGAGGKGGNGGRGGDAGNATNQNGGISVTIPAAYASLVNKGSTLAPPGNFGLGGAFGTGGAAGGGSSGGKGHSGGSAGTTGSNGSAGSPGNASQTAGIAATITINLS